MKTLKTLLLIAIAFAATACANNPINYQAARTSDDLPQASSDVPVIRQDETLLDSDEVPSIQERANKNKLLVTEVVSVPQAKALEKAVFDNDPVAEPQIIQDPWESFNRKIHGFNNIADEFVLRPIARSYKKFAPEPIQDGVSNFFGNLNIPVTAVNLVFQGRFSDAASSIGRFTLNTTIGIIGIFDPASKLGLPQRDEADFGQTLAIWGWKDSRYLVLPLLGPSTFRDTFGVVGDYGLSPLGYVKDKGVANGLQTLEIVDMRARTLKFDDLRGVAIDDYLFVRDIWAQRRKYVLQEKQRANRD